MVTLEFRERRPERMRFQLASSTKEERQAKSPVVLPPKVKSGALAQPFNRVYEACWLLARGAFTCVVNVKVIPHTKKRYH